MFWSAAFHREGRVWGHLHQRKGVGMFWYTGRSFLEASHDGEVIAAELSEGQNHGSEAEYS